MADDKPENPRPNRRVRTLVAALLAVVVGALAGAAVVPFSQGMGWFGVRSWLLEGGELYVLNLTDESWEVVIDDGAPHGVAPEGARLLPLLGGVSEVVLRDLEHGEVDRWEIDPGQGASLLHLGPESCVVVAEVQGLFDDSEVVAQVVDVLDGQQRLHRLSAPRVIWPRAYPGSVREHPGETILALEVIDCTMGDDTDFLGEYLAAYLVERMD